MNKINKNLEIIQALPSLYPLKDFEEEAILNMINGIVPIQKDNGIPSDDDRSGFDYFCPCCEKMLDEPYYDKITYCTNCGCKIKWDE